MDVRDISSNTFVLYMSNLNSFKHLHPTLPTTDANAIIVMEKSQNIEKNATRKVEENVEGEAGAGIEDNRKGKQRKTLDLLT